MMANHLARSARGPLVVALALLLVACRSSSPGVPGTDGEGNEDGGGIDLVVDGDGEGDATVEADSAIDSGNGGPDAANGEVRDGGGAIVDGLDGPSPTDRELCTAACMATAMVAACPAPLATCLTRCEQQVALGICVPALRALLQCQASVGPEGYDCVATGIVLKAGLCAAESKARADCRTGDAGSGDAGSGDAGTGDAGNGDAGSGDAGM